MPSDLTRKKPPKEMSFLAKGWRDLSEVRTGCLAFLALTAAAPVFAADEAPDAKGSNPPIRGIWLAPYVSADSTYTRSTDVSGLQSNDLLLRVTPGLRLTQRSGRVQASLNYSANLIARRVSGGSREREILNSLEASLNAEVVPGWGYFNAQATISQQPISAYGRSISNGAEANANRTEVSTVRLTPYIQGGLGAWADYRADWSLAATRSGNEFVPNSRSTGLSGSLSSRKGASRLGWSAYGSTQTSNFSGQSRNATTDQVGTEISFAPDVDWRFHVRGGLEYSDVATADRRRFSNYGAGMQWTPSPRTRLVAEAEQRYFGRSHRFTFDHRAVFGNIHYSDGFNVVTGSDARTSGLTQTLYQLYSQQLAAVQPDPIQLDQYVRNLIAQLGRRPEELVSGAFLMPGITVQKRRELSLSYLNRRLNGAFTLYQTRIERIDSVAQLTPTANEPIAQSGYNATIGWKLTPLTSASLGYSLQKTAGTSNSVVNDSTNGLWTVSLNQQLGRRVLGSLSLRRIAFDSGSRSQRDTGISGFISLTY
jgi:uncharacterized protein (PEP-CTERM system associated)